MPYFNDVHLTPGSKITANGKQGPVIADHVDPATASSAEIATKQNQILAVLRDLRIIKE
ncbi:hypothetical protein [Terrihalobacillus insolitus]|uniref:hypothetical protein n=1 Tax=Terrihalobacillus insolitus TaxID=2950438 RepID=UPI0023410B5A|nr:hypothetical protein [Terrihalobacillus insolitus]MDC3412531.1 hypothetical protein [Terrihalobacillus insolitus]